MFKKSTKNTLNIKVVLLMLIATLFVSSCGTYYVGEGITYEPYPQDYYVRYYPYNPYYHVIVVQPPHHSHPQVTPPRPQNNKPQGKPNDNRGQYKPQPQNHSPQGKNSGRPNQPQHNQKQGGRR